MKTLDSKSLIIGVLLTLLIVSTVLLTTSSSTRAWEYKEFSSRSIQNTRELKQLGEEGWELVGYTFSKDRTGHGNDLGTFVFKRAKRTKLNWKFWE